MTTPRDEETTDAAAGTSRDSPGRITAELQELGRQLASTARTAWQSEKRQEVQQEVVDGLRSLRDQVTEVLDTVRADPRTGTVTRTVRDQVDKVAETVKSDPRTQSVTQAVKEQADKVAGAVRGLDPVDELRSGLANGLRELNEQLRRLADRLAERPATETATERDERSTGETHSTGGVPLVTDMRDAIPVATPRTSTAAVPDPITGHIGGGVTGNETDAPRHSVDGLPRGPERGGAG